VLILPSTNGFLPTACRVNLCTDLPFAVELSCAYDSPVPTEPQTDLPEAHLLEKEEVQEEALLSFPRLPTTKSISREPLYLVLSLTVPISLRSLPASSRPSFPGASSTSSTDCHFSATPIAEPIPRSPSSIIHAKLRSKLYARRLVRLTGCQRLGSPTLCCKSRCTLQAQSTNQSPTAAIACCNSLATPAFFFRQCALQVLSSFGKTDTLITNELPPRATHPIKASVRRYIPHLPRQILPAILAAALETLYNPPRQTLGLNINRTILFAISHPR
jgi:hypothetical protein